MNLICKIFGHRWGIINSDWKMCDRCHEVEGPEPPLFTIHENEVHWNYKPKKKGGENK